MNNNCRFKSLIKSAAVFLVCLFFMDSVCFADMDTLATLSGNQDIYAEMKENMNERLSDHQRFIDESIKEYAEGHADSVVSLTDLLGINNVFRESVKLSKGEGAVEQMEEVLASSGGRIQVMFIENENKLSVFDGKIVWAHAGTYITVFALESERDTEKGKKKIVARLFHEIWARSRRAKDLYNEEIKKKNPKTHREVKEAAEKSRQKYEKEVEQVVAQIKEFGYITSPKLQETFAGLNFENKIDFINRDFTYPGEVDKFLKPDRIMELPSDSFTSSEMNFYNQSQARFISKDGKFFFYKGVFYNTYLGEVSSLQLKGEVSKASFSPREMCTAVNYKEDDLSAELIDMEMLKQIEIDGLNETVEWFGSFSSSGNFISAELFDGKVQIVDMEKRKVVTTLEDFLSPNGEYYPAGSIACVNYSDHDKYYVVSVSHNKKTEAMLFDMVTGKQVDLPETHGSRIKFIYVSSDEKYANLEFSDSTKMIFEFKTKKEYSLPPGVKSLDFLSIPDSVFILFWDSNAKVYNFKKRLLKDVTTNVYGFKKLFPGDDVFIVYDDGKIDSDDASSALYSLYANKLVSLNTKNAVEQYVHSKGASHLIIHKTRYFNDNLIYETKAGKLVPISLDKYNDKPFFSADGSTLVVFSPSKVELYNLVKPVNVETDVNRISAVGLKNEKKETIIGVLESLHSQEKPQTIESLMKNLDKLPFPVREAIKILKTLNLLKVKNTDRMNGAFSYELSPILKGLTNKQMQAICGIKEINRKIKPNDMWRVHSEIIKKIHAVIHDENLRLAPAVSEGKVLWHVFANELFSYQEQASSFLTDINQMSEDKNGSEKIRILNGKENLGEVLENLAKDSNNIVHVMINEKTSLEDIPEKIKIAIFNGELGDCSQVIGMMAVSRALAIEDITERNKELCRLFQLLTGEPFTGEFPETNDPKILARAIIFNLPAILVVGINELPILNESTIFYLKHV